MDLLSIILAVLVVYLLMSKPTLPVIAPYHCACDESQEQSSGKSYLWGLYTTKERRFKKTWEDPFDEDQY
ncbi:MAG: hypothetical protein KBD27_01890 [Candidatus Moranbacteria bacterium]|nr:hypothetical protein [Candidatus Moranbacteria bacterium]